MLVNPDAEMSINESYSKCETLHFKPNCYCAIVRHYVNSPFNAIVEECEEINSVLFTHLNTFHFQRRKGQI